MSGIVGIVNRDGAPVDRRLLERLTATLGTRGPDGQRVWLDGGVGLGHAWLRTTDGAPDVQPFGLGDLWIVADARIDDRDALIAKLQAHGVRGLGGAGAAVLILTAYRQWGEECLRHLLGDFAFAIWDGARRRLFCARDHFGVKPFFYAQTPGAFVFGNTLECVRLHPGVSGDVNAQAIGDFLLFGLNQDPATTAFTAIRRLPAAHALAGSGSLEPRRYWTLPIDGGVRYARAQDYIARFEELLDGAVADRVHGTRAAGVLMSGGLDSTSVAASARGALSRATSRVDLRAYTTVCDRLFADPERRYAALAAGGLGIPIHYRVADEYELFERWTKPELRRPEPEADPMLAITIDQLQEVAAHSRVALTGHGGDPAFRVPVAYAVDLLRRGHGWRLAREVGRYLRVCRRLPRVRLGVHLRRWLGPAAAPAAAPPAWLEPGLAARLDLREGAERAVAALAHPTRPEAYALLTSGDWPATFESYDAGVTGVPVEVRHPFFDVRLVEYLLAIPPMPWCFDKTILRLAMRGRVPDAVRLRPKAVAAGDLVVAALARPGARWVDRFDAVPALGAYVRRDRVPAVHGRPPSGDVWTHLRPLALNHWLAALAAEPATERKTA